MPSERQPVSGQHHHGAGRDTTTKRKRQAMTLQAHPSPRQSSTPAAAAASTTSSTSNRRVRRHPRQEQLIGFLREHRGEEWHVNDIDAELGFPPGTASSTMSNLIERGKIHVDHPRRGTYVFRGTANSRPPVQLRARAEVVAMLDDNRLLLSVEGRLYVGSELAID